MGKYFHTEEATFLGTGAGVAGVSNQGTRELEADQMIAVGVGYPYRPRPQGARGLGQ